MRTRAEVRGWKQRQKTSNASDGSQRGLVLGAWKATYRGEGVRREAVMMAWEKTPADLIRRAVSR